MPCRCDGYPEPEPDTHNGPVAEMLCASMQEHEKRGEMSCFTKEQLEWWEEHKKRDKLRVEQDIRLATRQKDRTEALARLSQYERDLLGITLKV